MTVVCSKNVNVFTIVQNDLAILGIESHESIGQQTFNRKNVKALAIFFVTTISSAVYLCREPIDFTEYNQSLCYSFSVSILVMHFALVIWKQPELLEYIKSVETIVNECEL